MTSSFPEGGEPRRSDEPIRLADPAARHARGIERMADLQTLVVGLAVALALLYLLSDVVLVLFAATLLACQLQGAAATISRHTRIGYGLALAVVVLAIVGVLGLAFWLRGPVIVAQVSGIADQVERQATQIWHHLGDAGWLKGTIQRIQTYAQTVTGHLPSMAAGFVTGTLGNFGTILLIVVAGIYLASSPKQYADGLVALMPRPWRRRASDVLAKEGHTLRLWFIGQLADMATIGVLTGLGLLFLGVQLWPTLGLIAALCNFVPYIGALAGSVPAIVVGLSQGPETALYVAILFVAVQTLEGNVIAPLIQRSTVDLPPVVTLLSQTVLGTLFGPLGLILATPITAAVMVLVRMVYVEAILGDESPPPQATETNGAT